MISLSKNKWLKYAYMKRHSRLAKYLPETKPMTSSAFWSFMDKYEKVIVKPTGGSRGRGVVQVKAKGSQVYEVRLENRKVKIWGKTRTFAYVCKLIGSDPYIVQKRVSRAKINGRPFDMRIVVQRKPNSRAWKVTAKAAKVAGKGYIVSNITRSKGSLLKVQAAFKKSGALKSRSYWPLRSKINRVAVRSARRLSRLFPGHRIYGLDMAVDRKGRLWIIEANLYPAMSHFIKMKDHSMYRKIMKYKRG
jgi:hypothetical protein